MKLAFVSWNARHGYRHFSRYAHEEFAKNVSRYCLVSADFTVHPQSSTRHTTPPSGYALRMIHQVTRRIARVFHRADLVRRVHESLFDLFALSVIDLPDIVYFDKPYFVNTLAMLRGKGSTTIAYQPMPHYNLLEKVVRREEERFGIRSFYKFDTRADNRYKGLAVVDHIIAHSQIVQASDEMYGIDPSKIQIDYGCVDANYYRPGKHNHDPSQFVVMYVGNDDIVKGLPYLLDAWEHIQISGITLQIIGRTTANTRERYMLYDNIVFLGILGSDKVRSLYQAADVLVVPSVIDAGPKAALEAMACGCPVIISNMAGYSEIIDDGYDGIVIPARDSDAIACSIQRLYSSRDLCYAMGTRARQKAKSLSGRLHAKSIYKYIMEVYSMKAKEPQKV